MDSNTALQTVEEPATQTKRCSRCGEHKPVGEFYKSSTNTVSSQCRECIKAKNAERALGVKRCSVCGEIKPRTDFYVYQSHINLSGITKISSVCKDCIKAARKEIGTERKICSKCRTQKPLYEFYADASLPDKHKRSCKRCWNETVGIYPEDTVGEHVEPQIVSIIRELAELENRLNEAESSVGILKGRQDVLKTELVRICTILRTGADPVERRCDYGRIRYDDAGLSVTLEPEMAVVNRGVY